MLIAQISDPHVRASDAPATLGVDNNANLAAAVRFLQGLRPRPDVVLATGDLTNRGAPDEYEALHRLLAELSMPLFVIPGNHDDRALLRETFSAHAYLRGAGDFCNYAVDAYPVRLIGVDTTIADRHDGALCDARLDWLAASLAQAPDRPTLVFMHHPPFKTGIWWLDGIGLLQGGARFERIVAANPQLRLIVCGHVHRAVQSQLAGTPVIVAPSTAHQVRLDLVAESPPAFVTEPPALNLHYWVDTGFVSHTAFFEFPAETIDLTRFMDWEKRRETIRKGQGTPKKVGY